VDWLDLAQEDKWLGCGRGKEHNAGNLLTS
jgi:hypothetical protein